MAVNPRGCGYDGIRQVPISEIRVQSSMQEHVEASNAIEVSLNSRGALILLQVWPMAHKAARSYISEISMYVCTRERPRRDLVKHDVPTS